MSWCCFPGIQCPTYSSLLHSRQNLKQIKRILETDYSRCRKCTHCILSFSLSISLSKSLPTYMWVCESNESTALIDAWFPPCNYRWSNIEHSAFIYIYKYIYIYHHHHHVVPLARISLTLSRHFSLSFRSSGLHPVSSQSCCMYFRDGRPAFAWPYAGVHRSTSLMSSSLLLQQCPACLVRLTWIVFVMGGRWLYS